MEIKMLPLNAIKTYDRNPRKNDQAVNFVKNSIQEFGFKQPIVVDENNVIIAGHTRYKAARLLKLKEVPCIVADDLSSEQIKAYRIADNKVGEIASWDIPELEFELNSIGFDMTGLGFDVPALDVFYKTEQKTANLLHKFNDGEEKPDYASLTQNKVENICNLGTAQFKGIGTYDIPIMNPVYDLPNIDEWIGFNYMLSENDPENKGIHFFVDDYQISYIQQNQKAKM